MSVVVGEDAPSDWPRVALGHLVRFRNGQDYQSVEDADGPYPVIGSGGPFARANFYLHDGESVLFGRKGTVDRPRYENGRFWTVDTMYFTEVSPRLDARFLYWWATTVPFGMLATNTALPSVTQSDLSSLRLPLPAISDQAQIAAFLDRATAKIDALIAKQDALVARLGDHRRSMIAEAVEGALDSASGARFKHFATDMRQGWSPQCESVPADGVTEWGVLKTGCVNGGVFRPEENKLLPADVEPRPETVVRRGEVVISRASTRDLVGSAAVVEAEYPRLMLSDKTYAIAVDQRLADPWFISSFLGTPRIRQAIELEATGASHSMQNVSKEDLLNLQMPLPPVETQVDVARALKVEESKVHAMVDKAQELSSMLRERRTALITAAVTGRLDVTTYGKAG